MQRVIAYIDGFNLYYGLRASGWKQFYWLNLQQMARLLLISSQTLMKTKYFTSVVKQPPDKRKRQAVFLDALRTLSDFDIYLGHFLADKVTCRQCGHVYTTHHEKMTDVNIATELMTDAFQDHFDVALLVSADSDLVGPIRAVRQLFRDKVIVVYCPPRRYSNALKAVSNAYRHIGQQILAKSTFPDQITTATGHVLQRPVSWQ
jgi:uncharacterized LabA/DUF88 family protein